MATSSTPGPLVAGAPTTLSIYPIAQLAGSPLLPSLFRLINTAFRDIHHRKLPAEAAHYPDRLTTPDDFVHGMRDAPDTFVLLLTRQEPDSDTVLATASCRPHLAVDEPMSPWVRRLGPEAGALDWELKLLAVDPTLQRSGLAVYLMGQVEREVVARSQAVVAARREGVDGAPSGATGAAAESSTRVRMVIVALKEATHDFYLRYGYHDDYVLPRGAPFISHVVGMHKEITTI